MSSQLPPSEKLPIFDSSVFTVGDEALTYNKALKYFLRFPFAQGTETLATTNVSGVLTANSTSIFNDVVTINNGAGGQTHGIIIYDPPTGLTNTFANLSGNLLLTSSAAKTITLSSGGNNGLVVSNTTLTTAVPTPISTDNSDKIATTAFVQSVNKPATTILVTTTSTNANYYIPMITANGTANYPLFVPSLISFNPSTGALTTSGQIQGGTVLANNSMTIGTAVANSLAFSINNGGQMRIYNSGNSQYGQLQTLADVDNPSFIPFQINPPYATYMNFNVNGLVATATSAGQKTRLEIGCGQGGANEVDMCSSSTTLAGGFNFYNKSNTVPLTLIGKIPVTQPADTDNSQNLATTAWVNTFSKPATSTTVTATSANANYFLPVITANTTANYPMFVSSGISLNPATSTITATTFNGTATNANNVLTSTSNTFILNLVGGLTNAMTYQQLYMANSLPLTYYTLNGTLNCPLITTSTSVTTPLHNTTAGGTVRMTGTTGQYSQFQQSGVGLGYDLNLALPGQGALNILTVSNYNLPVGTNTTYAGLGIGWNTTTGGGETDFINYSQGSSTGGFNFYNIGGANTVSLIAQIPRAQPPTTENSTKLATTAWVQSATLPLYTTKFTYFSPSAFDPTSITSSQIVSITGVSSSAFVQVAGIVPPSYKFRLSYNLYSTDYAIAYSFTSMIDIYPSRLTASSPVVSNNTSYGTGNLTTYNLTNAVAGLATTFNYTNATYAPYNRPYWVSCQNGGLFSGGNTTFLYLLIGWGNQISGQVPLSVSLVTPGIVGAPTALNPTNGFTAGQFAMSNYTIEYLGSNVGSGTVTLL